MADVNTTTEQQTEKPDPYVHKAGSAKDKELNSSRPYVADWERVIDKIKANAAANGGYYIAKDQKTGEPFLDPSTGQPYEVNALLTKIHDTQVAGAGFDVPGAGLKREGNHFYFKGGKEYAIPAPQPEVKETPKTEDKQETEKNDDNDKGFFARNKGWLIGLGAALVGGAAAFFLARRHNKKKKAKSAAVAASVETPTAAAPTQDAPQVEAPQVEAPTPTPSVPQTDTPVLDQTPKVESPSPAPMPLPLVEVPVYTPMPTPEVETPPSLRDTLGSSSRQEDQHINHAGRGGRS